MLAGDNDTDTLSVTEEVANIVIQRSERRGNTKYVCMGGRVHEQCVTLRDGFIWRDVTHCHDCHAARDNL